jgi:excisionase family DNA binding protein
VASLENVIDIRDAAGPEAHDVGGTGTSPAVWLSGQQAAAHVGVSWPTLRRAILDYAIPHVRLGRRWKIEASVLDDHLRRLARDSAGHA